MQRKREKTRRVWRMHTREGRHRLLAYAPGFKALLSGYKGTFLRSYELIRKEWGTLQQMKIVSDNATGIHIKKERTGSYRGQLHTDTFRVTAHGKDFFVKRVTKKELAQMLEAYDKASQALKKMKRAVHGFRVHLVKPIVAYETAQPARTFVVTEFYPEGKVKLVWDLRAKEIKVVEAVKELDRKMKQEGILDANEFNTFYNPKTRTILLFDVLLEQKT
ncbi:MAG: hypothetical protein JW772_04760 [Candidatus Diapherotrites archaeon]|nr:hypothetical protein [Candidatus Diapherotrites archaeon]